MRTIGIAAISFAAIFSASLSAQPMETPHADCPATPVAPPAEFAGWLQPVPLKAAANSSSLGAAKLELGKAAKIALLSTPEVQYPLRPAKPGGSVSYGGLLGITVPEAGTYRVALGSGAWIDLVRSGKAVESIAHGHGPECSGVRKMVSFPLAKGDYTLQIAANGDPELTVMVARVP